jgi:hypothetical protein
VEILLLLQARGQVTAGELAERLEVSPRTIYRAGGIRLLPGYRTDLTDTTNDQTL